MRTDVSGEMGGGEHTEQFTIRCRAIILHEGRLLLVRHPHNLSLAVLPGGHLEWGESALECITREVVEELGVEPQIGRLLYVNTFIDRDHGQPFEFFFEVTNGADFVGSGELPRSHAHEIAEIMWAAPADDISILPKQLGEDFKAGRLLADEPRFIKD